MSLASGVRRATIARRRGLPVDRYLAAVCESLRDSWSAIWWCSSIGRQGVLRKLLQLGVVTSALLLLEELYRLVVVLDHDAHVLLVERLAVQSLELLAHALVL